MVTPRDDAGARGLRIDDDGDDILALTASINLPVWKKRLAAGVREAAARRHSASSERDELERAIETGIHEALESFPLLTEQWHLIESALLPQALESLRAARLAYENGRLDVLALLDAERTLREIRLGQERLRLEWTKERLALERAIAAPLAAIDHSEEDSP